MSYRSLFVIALATALAVAVACHDKEKYVPLSPDNPNGLDLNAVLAVAANPTSVPADGVSKTRITAHIDPSATTRKISFATTLGTLIAGEKSVLAQAGTLDVDADTSGAASVDLKTVASVATARVTVSIKPSPTAAAIVRDLDVPFVGVNGDQVLTLTSSASSLPADTFSTATITAQLNFVGDRQQPVVFSASRGTLLKFGATTGGTGDAANTVTADATGAARIQLRSDATVGTARIGAKAIGFEREIFVEFTPINPSDIITLRPDLDTAPADGATRVRIVARVSASIPDIGNNRVVTFTSTDGTFVSGTPVSPNPPNGSSATVKADAGNMAIVDLKAPSLPALAGITATVSNVTARASINFTRAQPDTVAIQSSAASVNRVGQTVTLTVTAFRDIGTPTTNAAVTWEVRDSTGAIIGLISGGSVAVADPPAGTGPTQLKATATFDPDDTAAAGPATITATIGGVTGKITIVLN
jgi:hypothetical protein